MKPTLKEIFIHKLFRGDFDDMTCGEVMKKYPEFNPLTVAQQPLSGSDAEASSPKVATQPSDNGERCTKVNFIWRL